MNINFMENGNGFPEEGEQIIQIDDFGWHKLFTVIKGGYIDTSSMYGNSCNIEVEPSKVDYDDMTEEEQDEAFELLRHA